MISTVIISLLNALAALLPSLPALIDTIRQSTDLSTDARVLLDKLDSRIAEHEKKLEAIEPLPTPPTP